MQVVGACRNLITGVYSSMRQLQFILVDRPDTNECELYNYFTDDSILQILTRIQQKNKITGEKKVNSICMMLLRI